MPISAWIMFVFGCFVLYGGLIICIIIARQNLKKRKKHLNKYE